MRSPVGSPVRDLQHARSAGLRLGRTRCCAPRPPEPPRQPVTVVYGHEDGRLKSTNPELLLDPPRVITDELFHLRDKTRADTLAHIAAENAYADARQSDGWKRQSARLLERLTAPTPVAPELWSGGGAATESVVARAGAARRAECRSC